MDIHSTTCISTINALWAIVTGERFQLEDPNLPKIIELIRDYIKMLSASGSSPLTEFLPMSALKWPVVDSLSGLKATKKMMDSFIKFVDPYLDVKRLDRGNNDNLLDLMFNELENKKDQTDSCFGKTFGKFTMTSTLLDLFVAGMETTSSSVLMLILQLVHHPELQAQFQEEIDKVRFKANLSKNCNPGSLD